MAVLSFQIDHSIAEKYRGLTVADNLALDGQQLLFYSYWYFFFVVVVFLRLRR